MANLIFEKNDVSKSLALESLETVKKKSNVYLKFSKNSRELGIPLYFDVPESCRILNFRKGNNNLYLSSTEPTNFEVVKAVHNQTKTFDSMVFTNGFELYCASSRGTDGNGEIKQVEDSYNWNYYWYEGPYLYGPKQKTSKYIRIKGKSPINGNPGYGFWIKFDVSLTTYEGKIKEYKNVEFYIGGGRRGYGCSAKQENTTGYYSNTNDNVTDGLSTSPVGKKVYEDTSTGAEYDESLNKNLYSLYSLLNQRYGGEILPENGYFFHFCITQTCTIKNFRCEPIQEDHEGSYAYDSRLISDGYANCSITSSSNSYYDSYVSLQMRSKFV